MRDVEISEPATAAERDRLRAERDAATAQTQTLIREVHAQKMKALMAEHDLEGIVSFLATSRLILESGGIPVPPRSPVARTDAAVVLNAAVAAAQGKIYTSYDEDRLVKRELKAAREVRDRAIALLRPIAESLTHAVAGGGTVADLADTQTLLTDLPVGVIRLAAELVAEFPAPPPSPPKPNANSDVR